MGIIAKVGRKSARYRLLDIIIHLVLILGAISMVYPFLLMLSSSIKSGVDSSRMNIIPQYLYNDEALYQKYLESRYNEESSRLADNYPGRWLSFKEVQITSVYSPELCQSWLDFLKSNTDKYGVYHYYLADHYGRGVYPLAQRIYRRQLRQETNGDLLEFNRRYQTGARFWEEIMVEEKEILRRNFVSSPEGYLGRFRQFKEQSPQWMRYYINPEGAFVNAELIPAYGGNLDSLNTQWGSRYQSWEEITLPSTYPGDKNPMSKYWLHYVREVLNIHHLNLDTSAMKDFQLMLRQKYDSIQMLNQAWDTAFTSFDDVAAPAELTGAIIDDLSLFLQSIASPEQIKVVNIAQGFREYCATRYTSIESLNMDWKSDYKAFQDISFPVEQIDYHYFLERKGAIRWEFIKRNYAMALDQMLADAGSLRNTAIYLLLSIILALSVNPLAAYALSRFKPSFSYQIIMLFMLTMAFPAMVMGIPNFLMLKRLNMLNTFWALVLPAAADGYFIFLLKGFFDSLPKEIYESAKLDGAGEFRLFWQFTMYLSKPIMAVIALSAFNAAYRNFLFAFLVCQDQSMWTLMVHIYELMQRASSSVGYAALVIAAIPTLLVFIFFQNIIIKGIVVPMEK